MLGVKSGFSLFFFFLFSKISILPCYNNEGNPRPKLQKCIKLSSLRVRNRRLYLVTHLQVYTCTKKQVKDDSVYTFFPLPYFSCRPASTLGTRAPFTVAPCIWNDIKLIFLFISLNSTLLLSGQTI